MCWARGLAVYRYLGMVEIEGSIPSVSIFIFLSLKKNSQIRFLLIGALILLEKIYDQDRRCVVGDKAGVKVMGCFVVINSYKRMTGIRINFFNFRITEGT